jgi:hypothetical protein
VRPAGPSGEAASQILSPRPSSKRKGPHTCWGLFFWAWAGGGTEKGVHTEANVVGRQAYRREAHPLTPTRLFEVRQIGTRRFLI